MSPSLKSVTYLPVPPPVKPECNGTSPSNRSNKRSASIAPSALDEYYSLISLVGRKLKEFNEARSSIDICSLDEASMTKLTKSNFSDCLTFHSKYLSRVYPQGTRVTSSNFNPVSHWIAGSQVVALNDQALSLPMILNHGRFLENGGPECGYVLKPQSL
eukprot:Platyproteum_vivax@DN9359_c0_g1_i1.p1